MSVATVEDEKNARRGRRTANFMEQIEETSDDPSSSIISDDIREYIVHEVQRATAADTRISDPSWNKMSSAARRLWSSLNPDDRLIILGETAKTTSRSANITETVESTDSPDDTQPHE